MIGASAAMAGEVSFWRVRSLETNVSLSAHADGMLAWTNTAPGRTDMVERTTSLITPDWRDYVLHPATTTTVSVQVLDPNLPSGMRLIPAGVFGMGDHYEEGSADESPVHWVYVSAFHMDAYPVTKALWDAVASWAADNEYAFDHAGLGKATNHPVQNVNWYDVVKWCNARSEQEERTPVYYTDDEYTEVYRTGRTIPYALWSANGYRLPTEAEWEKAARGGVVTNRFPWWGTNTIDHSQANYFGYPAGYVYDQAPVGYHADYATGGMPYTSPVGAFEDGKSGYDVYDMAGNVWEWCWDWYDGIWYENELATEHDTRGPENGAYRVIRGGAWTYDAWGGRVAYRFSHYPAFAWTNLGFRTVQAFVP